MMMIQMMQKKDLFEKYFKNDFLAMVNDRVPNVRITVAKTLRHHFIKEISGEFVYDDEVNDAVRVLKLDNCEDVKYQVADLETTVGEQNKNVTVEGFIQELNDKKKSSMASDTDSSLNSEDEQKIVDDIKRHNSEDEIDHGPVL